MSSPDLQIALDAERARRKPHGRSEHYLDVPKSDPAAVAKLAIDGIQAGDAEIIADETSKRVLAGLSAGVAGLYPQVA